VTIPDATSAPVARNPLEIVLVRAGIGRYLATLDDKAIGIKPTRQPFFNAARALLALGHDPATMLEARYRGSKIIAMCSTIGEAAKWRIKETDKRGLEKLIWSPIEIGVSSAPVDARKAQQEHVGHSGAPEAHDTQSGRDGGSIQEEVL
jgi:hypothetical protein